MDRQQEFALDLSPDLGGSADRRDRRPRRQHNTSHYRYMVPARYDNLNVNDPGPSSRGISMPRTESRQAGKRPLRARTPKEKIDAINRVHNGESKAAVARDIGVPESTLRGWCKAEEKILSQANNLKTSAATLPRTSLGFEHVLTFSSDNSNNSAVGGGSSSRSTPTTQAMLGLPSTSGVIERTEEFEAGPAHKRIKHETSAGTTMANNNMSTSIRAPIVNDTMYNNPYIYSMAPSEAKASAIAAILNTIAKPDVYLSYPGSYTNAINILNEVARTNGTTVANAVVNTIANTVANTSFTMNMLKQQMLQQQMQQTNNTTLHNGNKRKHSTSGLATNMDIPKPSLKIRNQLPNMEKSGSVSQNYETMPSTNSSDPVQSKPTRNNKCLTNIIDSLRHPYEPSSSNSVTGVTFDAVNNYNNDDLDNETARKNYPDTLPPGCDEMVEYCSKLLEWLHHYGSPISTMKEVGYIQRILARLQDWIQKSKKEIPQKTNGMS